jgi:hypothetical protein
MPRPGARAKIAQTPQNGGLAFARMWAALAIER